MSEFSQFKQMFLLDAIEEIARQGEASPEAIVWALSPLLWTGERADELIEALARRAEARKPAGEAPNGR